MDDDDLMLDMTIKEEEPVKLRPPRKIRIPRREPTVILPPLLPYYPTPDKSTCLECTCFPKEEPYRKHKKLSPCQKSPLSLYELAEAALEGLPSPPALQWTLEDVVRWCEEDLHLPQYRECFIDNHIDGRRLLMLEDPSKAPSINIHDFEHIKRISHSVRSLYGMEWVRWRRSVGLPPRRPLVHCTWYHSRTGPSWGTRQNWTRADVLRWMKMLMPAPGQKDHWDMVWYVRPDFPTVKIARVDKKTRQLPLPAPNLTQFQPSHEYQVPRKFILLSDVPEEDQMIWMQRGPEEIEERRRKEEEEEKRKEEERKEKKRKEEMAAKRKEVREKKKKGEFVFTIASDSPLLKKPISLEGKRGDQLILARRLMNKPKFLPDF